MGSQGPAPAAACSAGGGNRDELAIAVVRAHLSGMALNSELRALGGRQAFERRERQFRAL
jgi:allophanate hydrolase